MKDDDEDKRDGATIVPFSDSGINKFTQGGEANLSKKFLEGLIEQEFRARGVPIFNYSNAGENGDLLHPFFLLRKVPYTNLYKRPGESEFVFRHFERGHDVRIECRWQQVSGSVDEKFPYLLFNARIMPEREVWIVLDGGGAKEAGVRWFKEEAAKERMKTIRVFSISEARVAVKNLINALSR